MKSLLSLGALLAASLVPAIAAPASADEILRQMSTTLAAAQTFRFSATREIDGALIGEGDADVPAHLIARIDALVQRPNKFSATR